MATQSGCRICRFSFVRERHDLTSCLFVSTTNLNTTTTAAGTAAAITTTATTTKVDWTIFLVEHKSQETSSCCSRYKFQFACFLFSFLSEDFIALAILRLIEEEKAVVEGAGVTAFAAVLAGMLPELQDKK